MHQRIVRQTLLMLYLLLSCNGVREKKTPFELENAELENQLKLLNKPAIKTIKTKHGDTYDCIDFYQQHAFDHPLLKDHNFHPEMKPTLSRIKQNPDTSTTRRSLKKIWSKDEGCPSGTIPIKRITKDDLIRQRDMPPPEPVDLDDQYVGSNNNSDLKGSYKSSQGYKVAIIRTLDDPNNKFGGGGMIASLYNPHVEGQQHSACRLKIVNGRDILQVGWRVDPTLYGDTKTRLFVHFQAGDIHCFNTLCPGFVIVNNDIPLDMAYDGEISQHGGMIWEETMYIERDLANGNWRLLMAENYEQIGFWPQELFIDLKGFGSRVEWGGAVYSPQGVPEPPMGSGFFPSGYANFDGYCKSIAILDDKGKTIGVEEGSKHVDNVFLYNLLFRRVKESLGTFIYVFYGGPGGTG